MSENNNRPDERPIDPNASVGEGRPTASATTAGQRLDQLISKSKQLGDIAAQKVKGMADTAAPKLKEIGNSLSDKAKGHGENAESSNALMLGFRIFLIVIAISVFLPWFSAWAAEGWGDKADRFGCPAFLAVLILLPTFVSFAATFIGDRLPKRQQIEVGGVVVAFLMILLTLLAGKPSMKMFGDAAELIQISIAWGGWIALVSGTFAVLLGVAIHFSYLQRLWGPPVTKVPVEDDKSVDRQKGATRSRVLIWGGCLLAAVVVVIILLARAGGSGSSVEGTQKAMLDLGNQYSAVDAQFAAAAVEQHRVGMPWSAVDLTMSNTSPPMQRAYEKWKAACDRTEK